MANVENLCLDLKNSARLTMHSAGLCNICHTVHNHQGQVRVGYYAIACHIGRIEYREAHAEVVCAVIMRPLGDAIGRIEWRYIQRFVHGKSGNPDPGIYEKRAGEWESVQDVSCWNFR